VQTPKLVVVFVVYVEGNIIYNMHINKYVYNMMILIFDNKIEYYNLFLLRWGLAKALPILNSMCYGGHRRLFPIEHYTRNIGQSRDCCPKGYYDSTKKEVIVESYFQNTDPNEVFVKNILPNSMHDNWINPCEGGEANKQEIIDFYRLITILYFCTIIKNNMIF